jgi:hypothetical protein
MAKEKGNDLGKDQSDNTPHVYLRSLWYHKSKLEEILQWETVNSSWFDSLGPE